MSKLHLPASTFLCSLKRLMQSNETQISKCRLFVWTTCGTTKNHMLRQYNTSLRHRSRSGLILHRMANALLLLAVGAALQAPVDSYKIAIVPKMRAATDFYGRVESGCIDKSNSYENVTCIYRGSFNPDVEENLRIINELIDDPTVDGISISVLDPVAYTPVINRGVALGKPIITFDSDAPESNRLAYIGTNNYAMGRELAKLLRQVKPDGGTFGIVAGFEITSNLQERVQGVRDGLLDTPWTEVSSSPKNGREDSHVSLLKMWELVEENENLTAIVSVVGLPMFPEPTTNWTNFVDANRDVLTVIADALSVQLLLMQTSYVNALVGQLPYNMGYQSAETLIEVLDAVGNGTAIERSLSSETIFGTHQLEILRIPLELPSFDFDYNYIGKAAIVGYVLCAIVLLASLGFMGWTWFYRKNQVVRSGQPLFLTLICVGTLLMGSAIIPLSIDDKHSQSAADVACMCSPWLINIGFTVAFSALFSKTWRLNKILLNKNSFQRVVVTEKDVMWPLVVLLTLNVVTLICWTIIAPLEYIRTLEDGTDPWNRPIGSYGQCRSTSGAAGDSIPYLVVIGVINITALVVANFQAYRARNVRTEFNESSYIAMANASFLQAIIICVPVLFLTRESPQAYFIVLSVILFILSAAILVFIFVPKMFALRERAKKKGKSTSNVRVSGMSSVPPSHGNSKYGSQPSFSLDGSVDAVTAVLQQYQRLSWEEKVSVKKKLSIVLEGYSSTSLDQFDSTVGEENTESAREDTNDAETGTIREEEAPVTTSDSSVEQDSPAIGDNAEIP